MKWWAFPPINSRLEPSLCEPQPPFPGNGILRAETKAPEKRLRFEWPSEETTRTHGSPPVRGYSQRAGKSLFARDCVAVLRGVSLPSVTNNLGWQTVLKARFDPKCNLAAVANPPLHHRPDPVMRDGRAAKRPTRSATVSPPPEPLFRKKDQRRRTGRAAAS